MDSIFCSDFTTCALADWTVEQHVPDGYSDFVIRDQKLVLLDAGNRILPNLPVLESFAIRGLSRRIGASTTTSSAAAKRSRSTNFGNASSSNIPTS